MASQKTITINGRTYDAVTGLPVAAATEKPSVKPAPAKTAAKPVATKPAAKASEKKPIMPRSQAASTAVHSNIQRSQTLNRRVAKKPTTQKVATRRPATARHMDIAPHPNVAKFAKHPVVPAPKPTTAAPKKAETPDRPAQAHPSAQKAIARVKAKKATAKAAEKTKSKKPSTAKQVKEAAINKALATTKAPAKPKQKRKAKVKAAKANPWVRRFIIIIASVLVLIGILFAVYRLVPSISVSIASAQAGIEASYPEYVPDGYALHQPVTYADGRVDLEFKSRSNDDQYKITQTRSSWDSSAVLDNVVAPDSGANYETTKERGLTIYTFENNAAWVNGGILYQIDSDAPLSREQIRRIATSL